MLIIEFVSEKGYDEEEYIRDVSREDDSPAARSSGVSTDGR